MESRPTETVEPLNSRRRIVLCPKSLVLISSAALAVASTFAVYAQVAPVLQVARIGGRTSVRTELPDWLTYWIDPRYFQTANSVYFVDLSSAKISPQHVRLLQSFPNLETVVCENSRFGNDELHELSLLKPIRHIYIRGGALTDEGLGCLRELPHLEHLALDGASIGDMALRHLRPLKTLQWLSLANTSIGDPIGAEVCRFPQLQTLNLSHTKISDAGILQLQEMKALRDLALDGTSISDASLDALAQVVTLRSLAVSNTRVTQDGLERFAKHRPQVDVGFNSQAAK
jgi:hypothetical protein